MKWKQSNLVWFAAVLIALSLLLALSSAVT